MNTAQERTEEVRNIRGALGLSQSEFARTYGVTAQAVNHWECGRNAPTKKRLQQIIKKTDMTTINVENDPVTHPPHYTKSRIEVLDAIEEWELSYGIGNVVKYCARADHKGNRLQDLCKAQFYLSREIEKLQRDGIEQVGQFRTGGVEVDKVECDGYESKVYSDGRGGLVEERSRLS